MALLTTQSWPIYELGMGYSLRLWWQVASHTLNITSGIQKTTMKNNSFVLAGVLIAFLLFSTTVVPQGIWISSEPVDAQMESGNQTAVIDQLVSNLSQAKESLGGDNTTLTTMQLTAIIGELSDLLGKVTTDETGSQLDEHTHVFVHKGHTHTVTHKHPHHADHHHHDNWFDRHHIFNPSDCKPGRMC
jgi:hypothetical protein